MINQNYDIEEEDLLRNGVFESIISRRFCGSLGSFTYFILSLH